MRVVKRKPGRGGPSRTSIALLESNPLAAEMIKAVLSRRRASVKHYRSFRNLVESMNGRSAHAEVIVLDRGSFPQTTDETIRNLRDTAEVPIILVDENIPETDLCNFIHSGINGFVSYCAVAKNLFSAIRSITRGQSWFDANILRAYIQFVANLNRSKSRCGMAFTERQMQIAALLKEGLSNKEIARHVNISESTVKFHLAKIFAKLDVHDRRSVMKNEAFSEYIRMADKPQSPHTSRTQAQIPIMSHLEKRRVG
jgi:DNA-binding NarL/FixJ family response regulator